MHQYYQIEEIGSWLIFSNSCGGDFDEKDVGYCMICYVVTLLATYERKENNLVFLITLKRN